MTMVLFCTGLWLTVRFNVWNDWIILMGKSMEKFAVADPPEHLTQPKSLLSFNYHNCLSLKLVIENVCLQPRDLINL